MKIKYLGRFFLFFLAGLVLVMFGYSFVISSESFYEIKEKNSPRLLNEIKPQKIIKYLSTPEPLKALYMTQCVAATPGLRDKVVRLAEETEINALVLDIKDYTGRVAFKTGISEVDNLSTQASGCFVSDMEEFIDSLHNKNIYVIGRITVFQDPLYTKAFPQWAVKKKSDGSVWKDRKELSFVDVGARPFWDYILTIATSSHAIGFDEINFDYIRFPSDGDMKDIDFEHTATTTKKEMLKNFFEYLDKNLSGTKIITSADLFGMTTTNTDDLNIGQVLEYALINFDYVAPMVYPSHYPPKFNGWPDPNKVPYEIVKFSMSSAVTRADYLQKEVIEKMYIQNASSTDKIKTDFYNERLENRLKRKQLRPWLQDFDYPVPYTAEMVRKQIQATYDSGLTSWMLWDPANTYTREALNEK